MSAAVIIAATIIKANEDSRYFWILAWPGTVAHELWHLIIAVVTGAKPTSFTVFPRSDSDGMTLGSVGVENLTWFNRAPIALAPLLSLPIAYSAIHHIRWSPDVAGILTAWVIASVVANSIPSAPDREIAMTSLSGLAFWGFTGFVVTAALI
jgi:hypothetical protein